MKYLKNNGKVPINMFQEEVAFNNISQTVLIQYPGIKFPVHFS